MALGSGEPRSRQQAAVHLAAPAAERDPGGFGLEGLRGGELGKTKNL